MTWPGICRLLGAGCLLGFAATAFTPLAGALRERMTASPSVGPAEAIVVLAASVDSRGVLHSSSMRRAVHGMLLYRRGLAPLLVFLGPSHGGGPAEADLRAGLARELGVPPSAILTESRARTTREEAQRTRDLLEPRGIRRILLVTGSHHMPRALSVFRRVGFEALPAPLDELSGLDRPGGRLYFLGGLLQEALARLYYRAAGYL